MDLLRNLLRISSWLSICRKACCTATCRTNPQLIEVNGVWQRRI